ncbi:hypothetical protein [Streptomyces olivochromogenes]|uniref:hypothetical protein n=1 Tax=Streptomyces olivochromogenes TaxID=1963 RepID=UPI001F3AC564|nr:hypothetical protein [Streptomyces olivochromogenes]MCF3130827.1 hypothetical protein [Streptomyces olivochromogenes]
MTTMRGPFDRVPLDELFPHVDDLGRQRMRRAVAMVDAVRPADQTPDWEWWPHHINFPGAAVGVPEILLTEFSLYDDRVDWLAMAIDVEWTAAGRLRVCAAVEVACWCTENHNAHYAPSLEIPVRDDASLEAAFEAAARQLTKWLEEPWDPEHWRARANLPQRFGTSCGGALEP